ncbi:MAG TPA: type II secretion system secretin GspD [Steroidobacteraceae bacterium]|nr:type II secretion system secretin GspD [Steroidobacteraceae bacterium]
MSDSTSIGSATALRRRMAVALAVLALSALALAQQPSTQRITPNFKDADITQIIEAVSMATGKNFIVDPRVRAQVTMLSSTPMTPDQFYQAFLAILQVHGFVAVPAGNIIKIVPDANMRQYAANDLPDHVSSSSDEMVTQVLAVQNINASQLVPVLRPLMPQNAQLSAVTGANILILSDRASNVNRMMRIIARIDQVGSADIDVIPLQSATAADTARVLTTLLAQTGEAATGVKVVADDRSNSILVSGDSNLRLRIRTLVTHLDTPIDTGTTTQVRYLRYSDAEDLAGRLKEQLSGSGTSGASSTMNKLLERNTTQPQPNAQGNTPRPSDIAAANAAAANAGGAATLSLAGGTATIWADKATNSLVITAGQRTLRAVNAVIDKLDIRRAQVLVQAIIVSVAVDKTADLGVNWAVDAAATGAAIGGFIAPIGGSSIIDLYNDATTPANLASNPPTGTTIGIGKLTASGVNFAAILRALQSDTRTNIIATPQVVTRDNQEAKMEVAQEVPFLTGQYSTTNGTGSAFQTIEREEVGTILTVTPTINEGEAVLLKLQIESSSLAGATAGAVDLITNKNVITTSVLIKDGNTLVLGGLIQDNVSNSESSVPLLGRIPLLGELFRARNTSKSKSDFLIFLQPHILRDDRQAAIETDAKYNYLRDEQRRLNKDQDTKLPLLPFQPADVMPEIHNGETRSGVLGAGDIGPPDAKADKGNSTKAPPSASDTPLAPSPPATAPAGTDSSPPAGVKP